MISNISFGSKYNFANLKNNPDDLRILCGAMEGKKGVSIETNPENNTLIALSVPDTLDVGIERYCAYNGILYRKIDTPE